MIELTSVTTFPPCFTFPSQGTDGYDVLVLSGGSRKGVAQLGFLHNMQQKKYIKCSKFHGYVGTSMGSIICFLLLIGYTPVEILTHICQSNIDLKSNLNFLGLFTNYGIRTNDDIFDVVEKLAEEKIGFLPTMKELYEKFRRYFVCVTHRLTGNSEVPIGTVYFDHISHPNLSCIEAMKMSINIPFLFGKYIYDKQYYVDGGISDNYAIEYASNLFTGKRILGISVENSQGSINGEGITIFDYIKSLLFIPVINNIQKSCSFTSETIHSVMMVIDDPTEETKLVSKNTKNTSINEKNFQFFSLGYKTANQMIPRSIIQSLDETEKENDWSWMNEIEKEKKE